jgi:VanZ family protein
VGNANSVLFNLSFRVSYWLVAGAVVIPTLIALIVDRFQLTLTLVFAVEIVQLVANLIVAAMYIIISKSCYIFVFGCFCD